MWCRTGLLYWLTSDGCYKFSVALPHCCSHSFAVDLRQYCASR